MGRNITKQDTTTWIADGIHRVMRYHQDNTIAPRTNASLYDLLLLKDGKPESLSSDTSFTRRDIFVNKYMVIYYFIGLLFVTNGILYVNPIGIGIGFVFWLLVYVSARVIIRAAVQEH